MQSEFLFPVPSLWGERERPRTAREWEYARKPELLELYSSQIYGRTPEGGGVASVETISQDTGALACLATMTQLKIRFWGPREGTRAATLLLYTPNAQAALGPVPVLVGLNFMGNHSTTADPTVLVSPGFHDEGYWKTIAADRAAQKSYWSVEVALKRGYAVATMHCGELEADTPGAGAAGVRGLFNSEAEFAAPAPDMWGTIGAWAWGLSRILDVLGTLPEIDATAAILHGHSRLGKTALWAAAQDPRFAAVISHSSGGGGAGLFRHEKCETVKGLSHYFPYWFTPNFRNYIDAHETLPIDQHHLLGLIAPRPVHVASTTADAHRPDFFSAVYASPVMELYGHRGILPPGLAKPGADLSWQEAQSVQLPEVGRRIGQRLSFHLREGWHEVKAEDWKHFADFSDANVRR